MCGPRAALTAISGLLLFTIILVASAAKAAEVHLLAAEVMKPPLTELLSQFEQSSGDKVIVEYDSAGRVKSRLLGGEPADVIIIQKPVADTLSEQDAVQRTSITVIGRSGIGVGVPVGTPRPDISSVDAFKRSLLATKSVGYPDPSRGAASGILFVKVLEKLGITREVNAKSTLMAGTFAGFLSTHAGAQFVVIQPMEILAVPTYELVGWLPSELQEPANFTWAAAITAGSKEPKAAHALIQFLSSPPARAVINAKGMETG